MTWQWVVSIAVAAAFAALTPRLLRTLPPPSDEPQSDPYRPLATRAFAAVTFALSCLAGVAVLALAPVHAPAWAGLGTVGVLAAMVDARTRYLPKRLMQAGWAITAVGVATTSAVAGDAAVLLRALVGAAAATALFWLFERIGGGFSFGDVRLAPIIGGAAAGVGWTMLSGALLLGGLAGVAWGLLWQASGRGRAFPYGPALVVGPYLALALNAWSAYG